MTGDIIIQLRGHDDASVSVSPMKGIILFFQDKGMQVEVGLVCIAQAEEFIESLREAVERARA